MFVHAHIHTSSPCLAAVLSSVGQAAEGRFLEVADSYQVLSDPKKRALYDKGARPLGLLRCLHRQSG